MVSVEGMVSVEYVFTPISGYAYLGHDTALALARRHGVALTLRPVDLTAVFAAIGVTPPPKQAAVRLAYRQADMQRWADWRGQPMVQKPRHWPTHSALASAAIIAAAARRWDAGALAGGLLKAVWERELDIAEPDTIRLVARECGLDPEAVMAGAVAPGIAETYARNTADAIRLGVPGSPTFLVGDTMIYGQDRMHFLDAALAQATGGHPLIARTDIR